jgi:hypothetical protein
MGSGNPAFLLPWRSITVAFVIMAFLVGWFSRKMGRAFQVHLNNTAALGLLFLLIFSGILGKWTEHRTLTNYPWEKVQAFVQENADDGNLYMTPSKIIGFRMNAEVAVFSDQLLVHGATLPEQYTRQSITEHTYSEKDFDSSTLGNQNVTHVIIPVKSYLNTGRTIYSDDHYAVIKLD